MFFAGVRTSRKSAGAALVSFYFKALRREENSSRRRALFRLSGSRTPGKALRSVKGRTASPFFPFRHTGQFICIYRPPMIADKMPPVNKRAQR